MGQKPKAVYPKVLVVEDEPIIQKVHGMLLSDMGYSVDIAENGKQALSLMNKENYHLVLMDIGLPDMCGSEVASIIRQQEKSSIYTPIVAVTAYMREEIEKKQLHLHFDEVLIKPLSRNSVCKLTQRFVEAQKKV